MSHSPDQTPDVLILSRDLFLPSQLVGAAQRAGLSARVCSAVPSGTNMGSPRWIIIDVETPDVNFAALRSVAGPAGKLVAYGPHMRTELLAQAQSGGCDLVLTRGQITSSLDRILAGT